MRLVQQSIWQTTDFYCCADLVTLWELVPHGCHTFWLLAGYLYQPSLKVRQVLQKILVEYPALYLYEVTVFPGVGLVWLRHSLCRC